MPDADTRKHFADLRRALVDGLMKLEDEGGTVGDGAA